MHSQEQDTPYDYKKTVLQVQVINTDYDDGSQQCRNIILKNSTQEPRYRLNRCRISVQSQLAIRRRAASERGRISAGKGFGKHDNPDVYSPDGVISLPSGPTALRISIVAHREAIAIQTLPMARNRPGQILLCS